MPLNNKDTLLALNYQVKYSHAPLDHPKCTVFGLMCRLTAICAPSHTCKLFARGVWIRSGGLPSDRMYREGSRYHRLPLAHPTLL